jgi:hypothetical protein
MRRATICRGSQINLTLSLHLTLPPHGGVLPEGESNQEDTMKSTEELVQSFVSVWNEKDPRRRSEMVRNLWRADGRHLMGTHDVQGHEGLEQRVAASNQRNVVEKGCVFRPATGIQSLPGVVKFRWDMARCDTGELISAGVGFLALDEEQRIICDHLFTET